MYFYGINYLIYLEVVIPDKTFGAHQLIFEFKPLYFFVLL